MNHALGCLDCGAALSSEADAPAHAGHATPPGSDVAAGQFRPDLAADLETETADVV